MSQGGDLSLHIASYYPELIHLACPIAGRLSEAMQPKTVISENLPEIVLLQGNDDEIVSIESARDVASWLQLQKYSVNLKEYEGVGHDINEAMIEDIREVIAKL